MNLDVRPVRANASGASGELTLENAPVVRSDCELTPSALAHTCVGLARHSSLPSARFHTHAERVTRSRPGAVRATAAGAPGTRHPAPHSAPSTGKSAVVVRSL